MGSWKPTHSQENFLISKPGRCQAQQLHWAQWQGPWRPHGESRHSTWGCQVKTMQDDQVYVNSDPQGVIFSISTPEYCTGIVSLGWGLGTSNKHRTGTEKITGWEQSRAGAGGDSERRGSCAGAGEGGRLGPGKAVVRSGERWDEVGEIVPGGGGPTEPGEGTDREAETEAASGMALWSRRRTGGRGWVWKGQVTCSILDD